VHLFAPKTAFQWGERAFDGQSVGQKLFEAQSPTYGAEIVYRVTQPVTGQVKVIVQDARGDTLATPNGPGRAGIQRVVWNYRGKAPPSIALSPAGVRDSIINARKLATLLDSVEKEGTLPKSTVDRIRAVMASGEGIQALFPGGFGGGGGGGFGRGGFQERPGENMTPAAGARGAGAGGGRGSVVPAGAVPAGAVPAGAAAGGAPGAEAPLDAQAIFTALGGGGRGSALALIFGGGGGRGGPPPVVGTGDYLVSITINGQTQKQLLHVERASGTGGGGGGFEDLPRKIKK
jgi:hypothetical protein